MLLVSMRLFYRIVHLSSGRLALFVVEFLLLAISPLLMHTYMSDHLEIYVGALLLACIVLYRLPVTVKHKKVSIFHDFK